MTKEKDLARLNAIFEEALERYPYSKAEYKTVTVGMVTAALAAVGEFDVSLSSMRRREVTRMIQAALDWVAVYENQKDAENG